MTPFFAVNNKVIYIRLAIMSCILVDTCFSILPKFWFSILVSAANMIWWEMNKQRREIKSKGTKLWQCWDSNPDLQGESPNVLSIRPRRLVAECSHFN